MADILIRGISLPEDELKYVSLWIYGDGRVYVSKNASAASSKRLQDLAIPLPEGHGRLGDLDALINNIGDVPYKGSVRRVLMSAPIIIPAEGVGDDG